MQDFGTKADDTAGSSGQLSAAEFNNLATELENSILRSGQALSGASDTQIAQSLFLHAVKSQSFQDSGLANAYVATPISGSGGVLLPTAYTNMSGAVISFKAANTNTGAATLNFGQTTGTLLGTKAIRTQGDAAIAANDILAGQTIEVRYNPAFNSGAGAWELMPWSLGNGRLIAVRGFTASATYTPTAGTRAIRVRLVAGGGAGGWAGATGAAQGAVGAGGGAGGYAESYLTSGFSSIAMTIGAGGVPTTSTAPSGGNTSFGGLLSATGGAGGSGMNASTGVEVQRAGQGGTGSSGNTLNSIGGQGTFSLLTSVGNQVAGGGGSSLLGQGGAGPGSSSQGGQGSYGGGGGGAYNGVSQSAKAGGIGGSGFILVEEYS